MPLIGRQFVRITEFNKLEQRVKKLEDNLGIQTQGRAVDATSISRSNPVDDSDSDREEEEREKKIHKSIYRTRFIH